MEDLIKKLNIIQAQMEQVLENQKVMHKIMYLQLEELSKKRSKNATKNKEEGSSLSLEERDKIFRQTLYDLFSARLSNKTIKEFCDYWTEYSANGKKMRFEMQKVFDIQRRMATWMRNNNKIMPNSNGANGFNIGN